MGDGRAIIIRVLDMTRRCRIVVELEKTTSELLRMKPEKGIPPGNATDEIKVGAVLTGVVSNVMPYGVFVQIGRRSGLCHNSGIPSTIDRVSLSKGRAVRVKIREITADQKLSLLLLEIVVAEPIGGLSQTPVHRKSNGAQVARNLNYSQKIGSVVSDGVAEINKVGLQYQNNTKPTLTGFVAEPDHTATLNIDATFQGSQVRASRLGSHKKNSADIGIHDEAGKIVREVSSKVYKSAEKTAQAQRGYGTQDRLVPKDQAAKVKTIAQRRAASERVKPSPNRQRVAAEFEEVAQKTTDHLEYANVKSAARTRAKSREIATKARKGKVIGGDVVGSIGERLQQGAIEGVKSGAKAAAAIATVTSTVRAVKDVRSGRKSAMEASLDVVVEVGQEAIDGAVKGAASTAATATARVMAEQTASQSMKRILGGAGPGAAAITGIEIAKHAIDLARGVKTAEEFRQASKASAKAGAASYIGAEIGFAIGGPVGALVGGIAGPMVADKAEEVGLGVRLERLFSTNTAKGHTGGTAYHLEQLNGMLGALKRSSAILFPERIIQTSTGFQLAAEVVMAHEGKIFAIDFKSWKGTLSYPEITKTVIEKKWGFWDSSKEVGTGEYDTKRVTQLKIDQYEISHSKEHRNPLQSLSSFTYHLKDRLISIDPRWKRVRIETLAVFPNDSVSFVGAMATDRRFLIFRDFLKLLADGDGKPTPGWILDGLSLTPTWDVLQDSSGNLYRGLIQTPAFTMKMGDGSVTIPFDAVLKLEVTHGGIGSRSDRARVTLHDRNILEGTVEKQEIVLERKGHTDTYLLRDLCLVCPAYSLLSA